MNRSQSKYSNKSRSKTLSLKRHNKPPSEPKFSILVGGNEFKGGMPEEGARDEMISEMTGGVDDIIFDDGSKYTGEVKSDNKNIPEGQGQMTFKTEDVFDGEFKDGFYNKGKLTFKEGPTFIGENDGSFTPGSFNGKVTEDGIEYDFEFNKDGLEFTNTDGDTNTYVGKVDGYNVKLTKVVATSSSSSSSKSSKLMVTNNKEGDSDKNNVLDP
jgi:hypothetical protein